MPAQYTAATPVAAAVPFDNSTDGFTADNVQSAIEEAKASGYGWIIPYLGDGSDGALTLTSGTVTLTRDMFYANVTLSGTAIINTAGFRMFVKGTLSLSGSSSISANGTNGNSASGTTGGLSITLNLLGLNIGLGVGGVGGGNAGGGAGTAGAGGIGYGGNGGTGGAGGNGGAAGAQGVVTYRPHRVFEMTHWGSAGVYKIGGASGSGGGGGNTAL